MEIYLKISENIYKVLCNNKAFNMPKYHIFLLIIKELKSQLEGSSISFKPKLVNIYEINNLDIDEHTVQYDLSLIPSLQHQEEFLLWLSTFIEKITFNEKHQKIMQSHNPHQDEYALFYNEIFKVQASSTKALEDYLKVKKL